MSHISDFIPLLTFALYPASLISASLQFSYSWARSVLPRKANPDRSFTFLPSLTGSDLFIADFHDTLRFLHNLFILKLFINKTNIYFHKGRDRIYLIHICMVVPYRYGNKQMLLNEEISLCSNDLFLLWIIGSLICIHYTLPGRVVRSFIVGTNILHSFHFLSTLKESIMNQTWT